VGADDATQVWPVPAALEGERLDRAVALITGLTRKQVNDVVDAGRVSIGRRPVTSRSRRVHEGEKITVTGTIEVEADAGPVADPGVEVPVVYADDHLIVVDKPAGLVVHPGAGQRNGTLVHGLLARYPQLVDFGGTRPGIVHRLDKGTSGLMVVALTAEAAGDLIGQLSRREVHREYRALLVGDLDSDEGVIDAPLARSDLDPSRIRVQAGGRAARTGYRVLARYPEPKETTLVACRLETGRTHQIRVHFASIGHPVVGDERYGGRHANWWPPAFSEHLPAGRPFLHAAVLEFVHPRTGTPMAFSAALPADLDGLLSSLPGAAAR
jgi:23S rRNA pseudouridine1911/1915/1917 synthase